jgi:aerobic-type carbon monoxide dehydrogenase small subunit (CoxS/CutS family)
VQAAFYEQYGLQCGFCTPGFVLATTALLERSPNPSREQIFEELAGHVCRCTGYVKIVAAVEAAARGDVSETARQAGATGPSRREPEVLVPGSPA